MNTSLDPKVINNISESVYKRFPEVSGIKPKIRMQGADRASKQSGKSENKFQNFLLTYHGNVNLPNGKKMDRWVRVVVDNRGKILKMTTSR